MFGASTLNVQQQPSIFSTLKTFDVVVTAGSLLIGILQATPLPQHVYSITGLVLQLTLVTWHPKNPLSHVSKQVSEQLAFCCNMQITVKISLMHLHSLSLLLLQQYS